MSYILHIDSSPGIERSLSRMLSNRNRQLRPGWTAGTQGLGRSCRTAQSQ
nr:hypothetical protein [Leptolyngbya sp. FACHB-541]